MENNSTVKYSSKHRYGVTKRSHKAKLAMARSTKQKADQEYDSDTTIIDGHCAEVCDCHDVDSLDVSCSEFKLNSLKTDGATMDTTSSIRCVTDLEMINALLTNVECLTCQASSCLTFTVDKSKRQGFAQHLKLLCKICDQSFSEGYTSTRSATNNASSAKPFTVNDMLVLFFSQIGVGYSGMQALGTIFGTEIMHLTTYQQKHKRFQP